jgi:hypothetical protein
MTTTNPTPERAVDALARQIKAARHGNLVECYSSTCAPRPVWELYKCLFCGLFFCKQCAAIHFKENGTTEPPQENANET